MGQSTHHPPRLLVVACAALLGAAACGGQGSQAGATDAALEDRCDLGLNTTAFNDANAAAAGDAGHHAHADNADTAGTPGTAVDFSLREWAEVFTDEALGLSTGEVVAAVEADDIYRRHVLGGVLTHSLEADHWSPIVDPARCAALADQLQQARAVAARHPTVAQARAAGYVQGDTYYAGLGVHFQNYGLLGDFELQRPVQLLYGGVDDDAALVGLSYVVESPVDAPPEGFVGDNDRWHRHRSFCLDRETGVNLAADVVDEEECAAAGGVHIADPNWWMLHVWVAPGCESDWGVFSGANPRLPFLPEGESVASGCGSGKTVADDLELDQRGGGLTIE